MDISIFYNLKERLYACAAAGAAYIKEDFRLEKAVAAMENEAVGSKPLMKLGLMCRELLTSDEPAKKLAECIALADALAVVQASFQDNSKTVPDECTLTENPYNTVGYAAVTQFINYIRKGGIWIVDNLNRSDLINDPRVISAFIGSLHGKNMPESAQLLLPYYGTGIIPLLKAALDTNDPDSYGNIVRCIRKLAGEEENEWYIGLASDENTPLEIRAAAIEALACSKSNTDLLLSIYRTEKSKIKNAALTSLAELDPDEASEIWQKMSDNYKASYEPYFIASKSKVCCDHLRKYISDSKKTSYKMLTNKKDADDLYLKYLGMTNAEQCLNEVLIANIVNNDGPEYRDLIRRLYSQNKIFMKSRLILGLAEDPENIYSDLYNDLHEDTALTGFLPVDNMRYSEVFGCYFTSYNTFIHSTGPWLRLFKQIPQNILDYMSDTKLTDKLGLLVKKNSTLIGKIISEITNEDNRSIEKQLKDYTDSIDRCCGSFVYLYNNCSENDKERIKNAALSFALHASECCPSKNVLTILADNSSKCPPEQFSGLFERYIVNVILYGGYYNWNRENIDIIYRFPFTEAQRYDQFKQAINKAESLSHKKNDSLLRRIVAQLKDHPLNI